jgi:hypothetical protein
MGMVCPWIQGAVKGGERGEEERGEEEGGEEEENEEGGVYLGDTF